MRSQFFGDADRQLMALLAHGAMFNLSPLFAPKRRFANEGNGRQRAGIGFPDNLFAQRNIKREFT
jgi:hypothetical protein